MDEKTVEKIIEEYLINKLSVYVSMENGYLKVKVCVGDKEVDSDNVYIGSR